jgi:hypothetical protein
MSAIPPPPDLLRRECDVFTRYLSGRPATDYVAGKYLRGHRRIPYLQADGPSPLDRYLLLVARQGSLGSRLADAYARFFRPTGALRQKLALTLAILENSPTYHVWFNSAESPGQVRVFAGILLSGIGFVVLIVSGLVLIGPVHLATSLAAAAGARTEPAGAAPHE